MKKNYSIGCLVQAFMTFVIAVLLPVRKTIRQTIRFAPVRKISSSFHEKMRANQKIGFGSLVLALSFFGFSTMVSAQPPYSRGEQRLPITYEVAMQRARAALIAEGFVNLNEGGAVISGYKGIHTAVIMCNVAPDATTWINIVVASNHTDGTVPGAERVKLQGKMNQPGGGSTSSAKWRLTTITPPGQPYPGTYLADINLTEENGSLTGSGTWSNGVSSNFTGTVRNNEVILYRVDNSGFRATLLGRGTAEGRMEGTGQNDPASPGGNTASYTWTAIRL